MKEYQTPHKLSARSTQNRNGRLKDFPSNKSNKITNKSLNAAFISDSVDFSPISEISDANRNEDVTVSSNLSVSSDFNVKFDMSFLLEEASAVTLLPSEVIPSKKITDITGISSPNCFDSCELDSSKFASVEAEIAVSFLRNVNSVNAAPQYRKLMNEIIEYVIKDLHINTLPEESDHFAQVLSAKKRVLFLCFLIWIIGVSVVLFFTSDIHSPYSGPFPT